jgi:hypothetical protein
LHSYLRQLADSFSPDSLPSAYLQKQALQNPKGFAPPKAARVGGKARFSADDPAKIAIGISTSYFCA